MDKLASNFDDIRNKDQASLSAKEKIIRTALTLFNRHGVHTTGIDRIIAESDVAKMTFYKHFPSKIDLIAAYLQFKHEARFSSLTKHTIEKSADPYRQILGVFDALKEWFDEPDFNGCPFLRGLTDFSQDREPQICTQVAAHFAQWSSFFEERLKKLVKPAKVEAPLLQLITLVVGSVEVALATKNSKIALVNKKLAESILKAAGGNPTSK